MRAETRPRWHSGAHDLLAYFPFGLFVALGWDQARTSQQQNLAQWDYDCSPKDRHNRMSPLQGFADKIFSWRAPSPPESLHQQGKPENCPPVRPNSTRVSQSIARQTFNSNISTASVVRITGVGWFRYYRRWYLGSAVAAYNRGPPRNRN